MATRLSLPFSNLSRLFAGARVQADVVGALLMREIHTRYGRDNIGYLWMFGEPALLAIAVATLHGWHGTGSMPHSAAMQPVPFAIVGYTTFIIFRGIIGRSESTIEANGPLLYHRIVTLFDMLLARALLEGMGIITALFVLLTATWALGMGGLPARPMLLIGGVLSLTWFSFALSMLVCAGTHKSRILDKIIHPTVYILMPISGCFYMLKWLPQPYRTWMSWFPMTQCFEIVHAGQFQVADLDYVSWSYLFGCNMLLTYLGMVSLRVIRRSIHLS